MIAKRSMILNSMAAVCIFLFVQINTAAAQTPSDLPSSLAPNPTPAPRQLDQPTISKITTADLKRIDNAAAPPRIIPQPLLHSSELDSLKQRIKQAVFTVRASHTPSIGLTLQGVVFDGACAALDKCPDVINAKNAPENTAINTCYITTADWLTGANAIVVRIHDSDVPAAVAYRDDAWNVAILKTPVQPEVQGVTIAAYDAPQSPQAYALIQPDTRFENFSQQSFRIDEPIRYGITSLAARNGYPLFNSSGELVGLTVSQLPGQSKSTVVHYIIIDRALYPEKYNRNVIEKYEYK